MKIEQFEDKGLAHFSYIVMSAGEIVVIDPARNPQPYYEFAMLHDARIVAVIETHPHADFVSSHREIAHTKEAEIYTSKLTKANYTHNTFDDGDFFQVGHVILHAINTPGHSPDSICVLVKDEQNKALALFTGDTLFVGDVGRPDLRESAGSITATAKSLAQHMYQSTRQKLMPLPDDVLIYPTHGAGSLCGKGIGDAKWSTLGDEKQHNKALQPMPEDSFVDYLLADQPFVPVYFKYNVELNKTGAPFYRESTLAVPRLKPDCIFSKTGYFIDTRPAELFRQGHLEHAINLQDGLKFETWLGSILAPGERFYLIAHTEETLETVIAKTAKIGYEKFIKGAVINPDNATKVSPTFEVETFKTNPDQFTIVDIRNSSESKENKIFPQSLNIPLSELRLRATEIPTDKPVLVHCAGGYRSAIGASIIAQAVPNQPVYDFGEEIKNFS
ncbi:MBL fold metallo-hydrolase [Adhaeribacter aquaticus]|uniref:MBL fold metallo-hydrolase n=1 Tax=Adhaeribacter aquaticus TaxID=299567 RepID=UPI000422EBA5|nr:MBL fold metallo-hydrolase [Adhaeribacter aquaticus]